MEKCRIVGRMNSKVLSVVRAFKNWKPCARARARSKLQAEKKVFAFGGSAATNGAHDMHMYVFGKYQKEKAHSDTHAHRDRTSTHTNTKALQTSYSLPH